VCTRGALRCLLIKLQLLIKKKSTFRQRAPIGISTFSKSLEFLSRHKPHKTPKGICFQIRLTRPRASKVLQPLNKSRTLLGITHSTPPQTSYKKNSKQPVPHHNKVEGDQQIPYTSYTYNNTLPPQYHAYVNCHVLNSFIKPLSKQRTSPASEI
jgi:hypothetical protein